MQISDLKPQKVFEYFSNICNIPHGSGNTKAMCDYCVELAKQNGCEYYRDECDNVIVYVNGTPGYENKQPVILQGHIDMVCDKTDDCTKNLETDTIDICTDGKLVWANSTTLGGDDGIAVAYMLALMEDKSIPHPPLDLLFTADEEIGMIGATALDASKLRSNRLINIDSEVEGVLTVSCAGGVRAVCNIPISKEASVGKAFSIEISGLRGGHSGIEINSGRINANKLLGRMLNFINQKASFKIAQIAGGKKHNSIPNEAGALLCVDEHCCDMFVQSAQSFIAMIKQETKDTEPPLSIEVTGVPLPPQCMDTASSQKALFALLQIPDGVQAMSPDIPDMVQTSLNLGIVNTEDDCISMSFLLRSNIATGKQAVMQKLKSFVEYLDGKIEFMSDYPAWEYRADSVLRDIMTDVYTNLFDKAPIVTAIHAGLECGILAGKIDNMDAVSFGPDIYHAHTPKESIDVASVEKCWEFLKAVLKKL